MAAGLAAGVVVLAGCSPHGSVAPSVAATAASSTPTLPAPVASPTLPEHWADTGERGAQAAAVWFVRDLYTYVVETNDSTQWQALSLPDCVFCANTTKSVQDGLTAGTVQRLTGVQVTVTRVEELNPLAYAVLVDYRDGPTGIYRLDGSLVKTLDGAPGQLNVVVHLVGPNWCLRAGEWFDAGVPVPTAGAGS
ncbi:DUF6318 family protein [Cellulomonas citrea]|uniref:DUF6318 family protein n=1 Tax=Cellulomonas citrea TaxID=1909423 RepID=UPI00135932DC|nr:DUF6318 family protein [Cellulomonas citrea]